MRRNIVPAISACAAVSLLAACGGAGGPSGGGGKISDDKIVLGVLNDQTGIYADLSGPKAVEAVKMAVEDFKAKHGDDVVTKNIEVVGADHQNKPEIANTKAQEMYDRQKADVILDVPNSAAALAVAGQALAKKKLFIDITAATTALTGDKCNKYTFHYAYDTYMLANGTGTTVTRAGKKNWYIVYPDYAFGQDMEKSFSKAVDHAGGELVSLVKQYNQFKLKEKGIGLAVGLMFITDIHSLGPDALAGTTFTDAWYWNFDDQNRQWADKFKEKTGSRPSFAHAGNYSAAMNYLEAVQAAGTDASDDVVKNLEGKQIDDFFLRHGKVRAEDHRVIHDVYLAPRLDLGEVDVVDDAVVLGPDLAVAQEEVVDLLALEVLDHVVGRVGAGGLDGLQVVHRGRVVAGVREGGPAAGLLLEPVGPLPVLVVEVPVPGVGERGAGQRVRAERVDVGDEHQPDRQVDALLLELELVVLLDQAHQLAAGVHGAEHVRLGGRSLQQLGREVAAGVRELRGLLADHLAAGGVDRLAEALLHVLPERVVRVDDVPVLLPGLGHRRAGPVRQHVGVVGVVEGVLVALVTGQRRRGRGDVDEQLLLRQGLARDGERRRRVRYVEDDVRLLPVVHLLGLGVRDLGFVLVVRADHLDVLGDHVVAVLGLEVLDRHLDRLDRLRSGQVGVDAGLVVQHAEHDLVVADLAAAARRPARPTAGRQQRDGRTCRDRRNDVSSHHFSSDGGSDAQVLE